MPKYSEICPTSTRGRVKTGIERGQEPTDQGPRENKESALDFSVQDASAALPRNCQTTIWIVGFASDRVNVTLVMGLVVKWEKNKRPLPA